MSKPTLTRHLSKAWCRIPGDTYHVYRWPRRLECVSKTRAERIEVDAFADGLKDGFAHGREYYRKAGAK